MESLEAESRPEERSSQEIALNNPIILSEILNHIPLKNARQVSQFWNEIVLSLPNTRFSLNLNNYTQEEDPCFSFAFDGKLARRISATCGTDDDVDVALFASRLTHFCNKFSNITLIMELSIHDEDCLNHIHQVLTNCCPNLKQLQIYCRFSSIKKILFKPLPPKANLTSFLISSAEKTPAMTLTSFAQVVLNTAGNLSEVTLPWGVYPNLEHCKSLASLTIGLDALKGRNIDRFKGPEMSRMLAQVSDQLVTLCLGYDKTKCIYGSGMGGRKEFRLSKKMPKLETYRNQLVDVFQTDDILQHLEQMPVLTTLVIGMTNITKSASLHEFLRSIFDAEKIFGSVANLRILEMHDPTLLEGLKTAFPNLGRLQVDTCSRIDDRWEESEMKFGAVLKACGEWRGLKRLDLWLPIYPEEIIDPVLHLLEGRELYKGLKTLQIIGYNDDGENMKHDLTVDELDAFKGLLLAMNGLDDVTFSGVDFNEECERKILKLMESNNLTVSKFRIFQGKSTRLGSD